MIASADALLAVGVLALTSTILALPLESTCESRALPLIILLVCSRGRLSSFLARRPLQEVRQEQDLDLTAFRD